MSGHTVKAVAARIGWFVGYVIVFTAGFAFYEYVTEDPVNREVLISGIWMGVGVAISVEIIRATLRRREQRARSERN